MKLDQLVSDYARACYAALTDWGDGEADVYWDGDKFVVTSSGCAPASAKFRDQVEEVLFGPDSIDQYTKAEFLEMVTECWSTELGRRFEDAGIL